MTVTVIQTNPMPNMYRHHVICYTVTVSDIIPTAVKSTSKRRQNKKNGIETKNKKS